MDTISFCYWLQGFMEMQNPDSLDSNQTQIIKDHLNEVFDKVTPTRKTPSDIEDVSKTKDVSPDEFKKTETESAIIPKTRMGQKSFFKERNCGSSGSLRVC